MIILGMWFLAMAAAQSDETYTPYFDEEGYEEITVYGDLFARWDNTRWLVKTEAALPYPMTFYKEENKEFQTKLFQLGAVLACEKDWQLGRHKFEINCEIEDFALRSTQWRDPDTEKEDENRLARRRATNQAKKALQEQGWALPALGNREEVEYSALKPKKSRKPLYPIPLRKMNFEDTECFVTLDVEADGSVSYVEVEECFEPFHEPARDRLLTWTYEPPGKAVRTHTTVVFTLRDNVQEILDELDARIKGKTVQLQVADDGRVMSFDLESLEVHGGRSQDIADTLYLVMVRAMVGFDMKLRKFNNLNEGQWVEYNPRLMSMPTPDSIPTRGSSMLVHQLNIYRGERVVQSVGKGTVTYGEDAMANFFRVSFNGVSIYDVEEGYMTERVWSMFGAATSSSAIATFGAPPPYWHAGRIRILDNEEQVDLGPTSHVLYPTEEPHPKIRSWIPLER
ncbi:MAG: hypothetical protein HN348_06685 [Proteobacteria bacterium]|nr:hypothetical protein [Pseudomonadota bacterium]